MSLGLSSSVGKFHRPWMGIDSVRMVSSRCTCSQFSTLRWLFSPSGELQSLRADSTCSSILGFYRGRFVQLCVCKFAKEKKPSLSCKGKKKWFSAREQTWPHLVLAKIRGPLSFYNNDFTLRERQSITPLAWSSPSRWPGVSCAGLHLYPCPSFAARSGGPFQLCASAWELRQVYSLSLYLLSVRFCSRQPNLFIFALVFTRRRGLIQLVRITVRRQCARLGQSVPPVTPYGSGVAAYGLRWARLESLKTPWLAVLEIRYILTSGRIWKIDMTVIRD